MMARAALNNLANATVGRSAQIPHAARPSLGARCNGIGPRCDSAGATHYGTRPAPYCPCCW